MKIKVLLLTSVLIIGARNFAQVYDPVFTIIDNPITYSMHICSDGNYFYTINGGVAKDGKVSQFKLDREFVASYPIKLDMRSIMYNKKDRKLYINTKDREIYKIADIANGTVELVHSGIYENEQATLTMDPKGKNFYVFDNGTLSVLNVKTGTLVKKLSGLKCGSKGMKGSTTVAVDGKFIYTWDSDTKTVFAYGMDGSFKNSFVIKSGTIGHSLSFAEGLIFVARSEMGKPSTWYGYNLPVK